MAGRASLDRLIADFGKLPTELRRELRPALRNAALPILADAKSRASWSTRIPAAISLGTSFTARSPGVRLRVDSRKAPHGRPFESGSGRNRNLRHPVFGNRSNWAEQEPRPFFFPAVQAGAARVAAASDDAVEAAVRSIGFR